MSRKGKKREALAKTAQRFLRYIEQDEATECWRWRGAENDRKNGTGYGRFWFDGKARYAHRVSYFLFVGDVREGYEILHLCDVPQCVNPRHLKQGTHRENIQYRFTNKKYYGDGKPIKRQIALQFAELISEVPF